MASGKEIVPFSDNKRVTVKEMQAVVNKVVAENGRLREGLSQVQMMFAKEDMGWLRLNQINEDKGLSLPELSKWANEIREGVAGNPHIKQGLALRANYVWQGGIQYGKLPAGQKSGKSVKKLVTDPINKLYFFGAQARETRESALYTDGCVFYIGDTADHTLRPIPIWEITADFRNPDLSSEIWAYRRSWNSYDAEGLPTMRHEWYFTDIFASQRDKFTGAGRPAFPLKEGETLSLTKIIFDGHVNRHIGWGYGVPDALSALIWARIYRDFMVNGKIMSDAMAQFAFQVATADKKETDNVAARLAQEPGAGTTAVGGNTLVPLATAGKGYDFESGRSLLSIVATAIGVSVVALSSDPGAAGSSYGSASTLDLPTRLGILARRQWHIDFDTRVLVWMGADPEKLSVTFNSLEDSTDIFRELQAVMLAWSSGLMHEDEVRERIINLLNIASTQAKAPTGVMLPNNEKSLARKDVDKDGLPGAGASAGGPNATPSGQGQNSPAGKGVNANDVRSDGVGEMMNMLREFIDSENARKTE